MIEGVKPKNGYESHIHSSAANSQFNGTYTIFVVVDRAFHSTNDKFVRKMVTDYISFVYYVSLTNMSRQWYSIG